MSELLDDIEKALDFYRNVKYRVGGTFKNPILMPLPYYKDAKENGLIEEEKILGENEVEHLSKGTHMVKAIGYWWVVSYPPRLFEKFEIPSEEERRKWREEQRRMLELWKVE